jgi:transcriptional regulator GlxA family with amidase domain
MRDPAAEHLHNYLGRLERPSEFMPANVRELLSFLNANIFDPDLTISDAMKSCGIRDKNISAVFRYFVSLTPRGYVTRHRLQCARELITHHSLSAGLAAELVGYHGDRAFSKAFRRHYGIAPHMVAQAA